MCILFIFFNPDASEDEWQLVVASNRDEVLTRPSNRAKWDDSNRAIFGTDESPGKEGGTWLGLEKSGKFAALLNILEPPEHTSPSAKGRGSLVRNFLLSEESPMEYANSLKHQLNDYNGFQLILLQKKKNRWDAVCVTNRSKTPIEELKPGVYGFGNSSRNAPFLKVQDGIRDFQGVLLKNFFPLSNSSIESCLLEVLKSEKKFPSDAQIKSQSPHLSPYHRDAISSRFIKLPKSYNYGTRSHTIILLNGQNNCRYAEETLVNPEEDVWEKQSFEFEI